MQFPAGSLYDDGTVWSLLGDIDFFESLRNLRIEDNVLLNLGATISHNCVVGDSSFVGVRTAVSGFAKIGSCCFIGTNSTISDNISICDNAIIGASAVVIHDVVEEGVYIGVPAKKM